MKTLWLHAVIVTERSQYMFNHHKSMSRTRVSNTRAPCGPRGHFVRPATCFGIFIRSTIKLFSSFTGI